MHCILLYNFEFPALSFLQLAVKGVIALLPRPCMTCPEITPPGISVTHQHDPVQLPAQQHSNKPDQASCNQP